VREAPLRKIGITRRPRSAVFAVPLPVANRIGEEGAGFPGADDQMPRSG